MRTTATKRLLRLMFVAILLDSFDRVLGSPHHLEPRQNGGKAGLAWDNAGNVSMTPFLSSKVSWYYTWSPWPVSQTNLPLEFVPMFWGYSQVADFQSQVNSETISSRGIKNVLGMNEPDQTGQSQMNAGQGAAAWMAYLQPLKTAQPSIRLGSPATTNAPSGLQWMYDFFGACAGNCTVDFVALHYYGLSNATDFKNHVTQYYNAFKKPIWVTEWACQNFGDPSLGQCSSTEIAEFLEETQSWMDATSFVERYAWLGATYNVSGVNPGNDLSGPDGQLTALGKQYVGTGGFVAAGGQSLRMGSASRRLVWTLVVAMMATTLLVVA